LPPWQNQPAASRRPGTPTLCQAATSVRDANGQALAYIYSRDNEAEARQAKVLTKDEARRIAANIARLPELLGKGERQQ
jgi:K+/H+ antiporter YhaU regulatory subunit KhtT